MNTAGKVVIGLLVVGGVGAAVMLSSPKTASAAPKLPPAPPPLPPSPGPPLVPAGQPQDHDANAGGVVVPPASSGAEPGVIPPPPGPAPTATPGGGITIPTPGGPVTIPPSALPQVTQTPGGGTVLTLPGGGGTIPLPPGVTVPGLPSGAPSLPAPPVTTPPLVVTAGGEPTAPADTIAVAQTMLNNESNGTQWRAMASPGLAAWQTARGLVGDGQFGPKSGLKMAQEIGAIPIIRGWPRGSVRGGPQMADYKASLMQIAQTKTGAHRDLLERSAAREDGQGFGTPPQPIRTLLTLEG